MRYALALSMLLMVGCAQVGWVKAKIATGVDDYCTRVTPAERMLIRSEVNSALTAKGHAIRVTCKGDAEATPASQ